jgi:hypothetical protein
MDQMKFGARKLKYRLRELLDIPSDLRFAVERSLHATKLPKVVMPDILESLSTSGIAVTHLEDIELEGTGDLLTALRRLMTVIRELNPAENHGFKLPPYAAIMNPVILAKDYPEVPLWGLQEPLLDLIENFIGSPLVCMGASLRRDLAIPDSSGTRRWHIDPNDRRYPKIILYLNDVYQDSGPFQYIPSFFHKELDEFRGVKSVSMQEMVAQVSPEYWCSVYGRAGTVIFVDTANLFHRGAVPRKERYTLFFSYTSKRPKRPDLCNRAHMRDSMIELNRLPLSARQRDAMFF